MNCLLRGFAAGVLVGILMAFAPSDLRAADEPYLSLRTGFRCSQCHSNRTGGGGRNQFGSLYAQAFMPMVKRPYQSRSLSRYLSVGGNFRVVASGFLSDATPQTTFGLTQATVQVEARVIQDVLSVYVDEIVGPGGASTREAFVLLEKLPFDGYLKAGKFLLPYGLRLLDDDEYIRQRTGFTYQTADQGFELGVEPGPLSLFLALTNGTQGASENNSHKQVTATGALVFPHFRIGGSVSRNDAIGARRDVVGGFAGFGLGRLTLFGEVDLISDTPEGGEKKEQLTAFAEGDFLITRGVNAKLTYGFLDPNSDVGENERTRLRVGVELFPIPFFQISTFYTRLDDIPQATTDLDRLSVELHAYF